MMIPKSVEMSNKKKKLCFLLSVYASIVLIVFYVFDSHCRWYHLPPFTKEEWGLEKLRDASEVLSYGRVLLILELVIPTLYKTVFVQGF